MEQILTVSPRRQFNNRHTKTVPFLINFCFHQEKLLAGKEVLSFSDWNNISWESKCACCTLLQQISNYRLNWFKKLCCFCRFLKYLFCLTFLISTRLWFDNVWKINFWAFLRFKLRYYFLLKFGCVGLMSRWFGFNYGIQLLLDGFVTYSIQSKAWNGIVLGEKLCRGACWHIYYS